MVNLCNKCGEKFSTEWNLERHEGRFHIKPIISQKKKQETKKYYKCNECNKVYKLRKSLLKHCSDKHEEKRFNCSDCAYKTNRKYLLNQHRNVHIIRFPKLPQKRKLRNSHQQNGNKHKDKSTSSILRDRVQERVWNRKDTATTSAFRGSVQERVWNVRGFKDPLGALKEYKMRIRDVLLQSMKKNPQKFYIAIKVIFQKGE